MNALHCTRGGAVFFCSSREAVAARAFAGGTIEAWHHRRGDEILRMKYSLHHSSVVLDVGGFQGMWAWGILERYGSIVHVFEPVKRCALVYNSFM